MTTDRPSVQTVLYSREEEKFLIIGKKDAFSGLLAWRLVKGGVKKGETDSVALRRELHEEVGLKEVEIRDRVNYYEFNYLNQNHQVSVYLVEANIKEKIKLQGESTDETPIIDHAWLPLEEAVEKLTWENEKNSVRASTKYL